MKTPDLNRNTLSKAERLSGKAVISRLLKAGVHGRTSGLKYCFFDGNGLTYNRILLSVPKRRFKRAVMRNLLKRRLREAYRTRKGLIGRTGIDFMLCYEAAEAVSFDRIRAAVEVALKEIGRRAGEKAAGKGNRRSGTGGEKAVEAGKAEEEENRRTGTDKNAGLERENGGAKGVETERDTGKVRNAGLERENEGAKRVGTGRNTGEVGLSGRNKKVGRTGLNGENEETKRVETERNTGEVGPVGGTNRVGAVGESGTDGTTRTDIATKTDDTTKTDHTPGTGGEKPASRLKAIFSAPFILLIKFYQVCLSPYKPPSCRFTPTCSQYAIEAFRKWGPFKGFYLTVRRLLRCHPWGGSGYDPVP